MTPTTLRSRVILAHGMRLMKRRSAARSSSCWSMRNTAIWRPALQSMSRANWWQRICGTASMKIFRRPYRNISLKNGICRKKKMWCRRSLKRLCLCRTTAHRTIRMCLFTTSRSAMPKKMTRWIYIAHPIG